MNIVQRLAYIAIIILVVSAIGFASWSAFNGEIVFNADIARDFLLYNELSQDPIMLIGPRADYKGLFHGPAWLYMNYPAYAIGQGNPVAISVYWLVLTLVFGGVNYWVGKKLFDSTTGFILSAFFIVSTLHYVNQFYNPTGAMFIAPLFLYCAYQYYKTHKLPFMLAQLFLGGMMLQFQLAAGIPILILSTIALIYLVIKHKHYKHFAGFLILLIPLSTFILFELRFGFPQFQAIVNRFNGSTDEFFYALSFSEKLADRYGRLFGPGIGFFAGKYGHFNQYMAYFLIALFALVFKDQKSKDRSLYFWGLYYFLGFYLLTFIHSGSVLLHYYLPFMFIPVLLFSSMHRIINKKLFLLIVIVILGINVLHLSDRQEENQSRTGVHFTSWTSMLDIIGIINGSVETEAIGVFVYAPDSYAYAPKYVALYTQRILDISVHINEKRKETYLIYEQAPEKEPWLNGSYWKTDLVDIDVEPIERTRTQAGYTIEKYILDRDEITKPVDPLALDWVSQR